MQISMWVPFDKRRVQRLLKYILRRQVAKLRVIGAIMAGVGAVLLVTGSDSPLPYLLIFAGVFYAIALEPFMVWQSMRSQAATVRQGYRLTLTDTGVEMKSESYDTRISWSAAQRIEEKPDAWYVTLSRIQACAVHKELMTEEQRAEFTGFLARRQSAPSA